MSERNEKWAEIHAHYESGSESLRDIAIRFEVPVSTVFKRAAREKWKQSGSSPNLASTFGTKPVPLHTETHTGMQSDVPYIPDWINSLTKLEAARFYHSNLKFAVHALLPPNRGDEGCRGKKPIHKGWRDHTAAEVTPEYLDRHFGPGSDYNLGAVVRAPFVHIDLDSKPDAGASVREWLSNQPNLASVPRERTGGGAHLLFICRDLPKHVSAAKKALTTSINPSVQAELYTDGMNIALSPSVHKSGHRYEWEVTGAIPEVRWSELRHWFAFDEPAEPSRGRPAKERPWWTRFKGSLHSLDAVALFKEAKLLGECIDPDEGKWSVTCPWENQHSKPTPGTSTVIFQNEDTPPGFKCLHAHCSRRSIEDVLCRLEDLTPGIVDRHCKEHRVFTPGRSNADGLPQIPLPGRGRPDSKFASELAEVIGPKHIWFNKGEQLVRISVREFTENDKQIAFHPLESLRVCTEVERYCETGVLETERQSGDTIFVPTSMSRESASKLINSPQFLERIPRIIRILDVQIPVMTEKGDIIIPKRGYDPVLRTWVPDDAPPIHPMPLEEAIRLIREIFKEFRWVNSQGIIHATARLLTPFCKGLCRFNIRTPLWVFHANQSGAGKDYCADVAHIAYTGNKVGDAPLGKDGEEIRKRITTFLNSGRRFVHFANCQFHIEDQTFIGLLTSTTFNARNLGSTNAGSDLTLPNEAEFSISANSGITFREDLTRRMRRIDLHLEAENQNNSEFEREYLHHWIFQNRSLVLSAIGSIVNHWIQAGMPPGPWAFSSFPEWAKTVGGIMHLAGLGNPCQPHITDDLETGGDRMTRAMTAVFKLGFEKCPNDWIEIDELFSLLAADDSDEIVWFGSFSEGEARATRTKVGMFLRKFRGRRLSGILMEIDGSGKKSTRHRFRFSNSPAKLVDTAALLDEVFGTNSRLPGDSSAPNSPNGPVSYAANSNSCPPCPPCPPPQPAEASGKLNAEKKSSEGTFIFSKAETPSRGGQGGQGGQNNPVTTKSRLPEIAAAIREAGSVALDIETYGTAKNDALNPWRGDIRLLALRIPNSPPWLIDLQATGYDLGDLGSALEAVEVIAHNAKFDLLWLAVKCGIRPKRIYCTLTASRLLSAGTKPGNNLDQCLERYLGVPPGNDHARSDWGGMFLTDDQLRYAVRDVVHLHDLALKMDRSIRGEKLDAVRDLEMALIPVVVAMEAAGMSVDTDLLRSIRDRGKAVARSASDEIRAALSMPMLNVSSPEQLRDALKRAGIDLPNTNEETLKASKDEAVIPKILAFRSAEKSAQQAESLLDCVESDNRIHGRFEPTGTETGRFASKSPNLQNIGRGELRTCFVAPPGRRLVVADYSQIELRAAAVIAREEKMIDAYKRGDDLHKLTASTVLGKPLEQVTKHDRQTAKSVAFGLLYGQSAKGLVRYAASSYGVQLADEEAQEIRKAFFRTYGSLRQWHGESHVKAEKGVSEVRTILGRRRLIPESADEWQRFTALVNTPVQGSCADGMKRALVLIATRLPDTASIISTVHDEVIVECNEADADSVLESVRASMIEAMAEILPRVPIEVEGGICSNWSQK